MKYFVNNYSNHDSDVISVPHRKFKIVIAMKMKTAHSLILLVRIIKNVHPTWRPYCKFLPTTCWNLDQILTCNITLFQCFYYKFWPITCLHPKFEKH